MGESDLNLLRIYTLKIEDHLTERTFNRLSKVFPNNSHDTCKVAILRGTRRSYGIRWRSGMRVTDGTKVTDG